MRATRRYMFPASPPHLTKSSVGPQMPQLTFYRIFQAAHLPKYYSHSVQRGASKMKSHKKKTHKRKSLHFLPLLMEGTPTSFDSNQRRTACQVAEIHS